MEKIYLNEDWEFTREFGSENYEKIRLPHTVTETPYNYFDEGCYQMISGYRRIIKPKKNWQGKTLTLTFEAAGHQATVYVNKEEKTVHSCGYTAFSVDLTPYTGDEEILVEVKLDSREELNIPPFGLVIDYMTYGGIYREVYLELGDPIHTADVFAKPFRKGEGAYRLELDHSLSADCKGKDLEFCYELKEKDTGILKDSWTFSGKVEGNKYHTRRDLTQVREWDINEPSLYVLTTKILQEGKLMDSHETVFGFREARFTAEGFFLNGKKIKVRGLNRHQAYPYVGYAMPRSMQEMDADILKKELSCNAVRTSHYPQSHHFLNRCDEIGLMVVTEIPGWQHIGDDAWKDQAVLNTREMVAQYRNHPSIILWGVRINESQDDDAFYLRTNAEAHDLDPTRQTTGIRYLKKSSLLEDVYAFNDFLHDGSNAGCEKKKDVCPDMKKGYFVSEYNGHMYPTKMFDDEEQRREHVLRHTRVLNAVAGEEDICGSFAWCMADYNTHKDFGSGDRICYHGVLDMYRNHKPAAEVYAIQGNCEDNPVLEVCSSMDIGEHPACNRTETYMLTNADSIRMYKNDRFIKEYDATSAGVGQNLFRSPIAIDDYIGDAIAEGEDFKPKQAQLVKDLLNEVAIHGMKTTPKLASIAAKLVAIYHMDPNEAYPLFNKYIGDWGEKSKSYKFEAISCGEVVKTIVKKPMTSLKMQTRVNAGTSADEEGYYSLLEGETYDVAAIRLLMTDENDNQMYFYNEPVRLSVTGPVELIGPDCLTFRGGATGTYLKTTGKVGMASVRIESGSADPVTLNFRVGKF